MKIFIDWGQQEKFSTTIGVGECAGVMIDLVATLILEAEEKIQLSEECIANKAWADAIYHAYAAEFTQRQKHYCCKRVQCNTQHGILNDFDKHVTAAGHFTIAPSFKDYVMQMNDAEPSEKFATEYLQQAKISSGSQKQFREAVSIGREKSLTTIHA